MTGMNLEVSSTKMHFCSQIVQQRSITTGGAVQGARAEMVLFVRMKKRYRELALVVQQTSLLIR